MNTTANIQQPSGVLIRSCGSTAIAEAHHSFMAQASRLGFAEVVEVVDFETGQGIRFHLREELARAWIPEFDTLQLCTKLQLHPRTSALDLEKEIFISMLLSPLAFEYPSYSEFNSSVCVRRNIVEAARHTTLAFHTSKIERPENYWTYTEGCGFTLLPGKSLIEALRMATQPRVSGQQYSFSCYRASEYLIVLGIAEELAIGNPDLLEQLQLHWQSHPIMSRQFHDVFMREYGSMEEPLPPRYYVPGDRLWFRNPDEQSSNVEGFEGSWVIYLGEGLFTNFWACDKPYSMTAKCIEIYHWRDGIYTDVDGEIQIDESIVEQRIHATMQDPAEVERILQLMMRMRDPAGTYATGGCIDTTREYPRRICPGTSDIFLPAD
jgi:hypothetical protein